jgi:dihydroorotate dehydrogenase
VEQPEPGGQSGHALTFLATRSLEWAYEVHKGSLPMIASGGIFTGLDVFHRLQRGADFVQIYTAFVYEGPLVIKRLLQELRLVMAQYGFKSVRELHESARDQRKGIR